MSLPPSSGTCRRGAVPGSRGRRSPEPDVLPGRDRRASTQSGTPLAGSSSVAAGASGSSTSSTQWTQTLAPHPSGTVGRAPAVPPSARSARRPAVRRPAPGSAGRDAVGAREVVGRAARGRGGSASRRGGRGARRRRTRARTRPSWKRLRARSSAYSASVSSPVSSAAVSASSGDGDGRRQRSRSSSGLRRRASADRTRASTSRRGPGTASWTPSPHVPHQTLLKHRHRLGRR